MNRKSSDITTEKANPKEGCGSSKLPLHLVPFSFIATVSVALLNGALKYGRSNWRDAGIYASTYQSAASRHLLAWFEGEEKDPDDGVDHLAAAAACIAILIDARATGKMIDDRNIQGGFRTISNELTPEVNRLKELHKDKHPKHFTIKDNE